MSTEMLMYIAAVVIALLGFWLNDWKSKIETKYTEFDKHKTDYINRIHNVELDLAHRITRDEITQLRHEIRDDFQLFKSELQELIKGFK